MNTERPITISQEMDLNGKANKERITNFHSADRNCVAHTNAEDPECLIKTGLKEKSKSTSKKKKKDDLTGQTYSSSVENEIFNHHGLTVI